MFTPIKDTKLTNLFDQLISSLSKRKDFFNTAKIIVPNRKIEQAFKAYWLKTQDKVLMNVSFLSLENGLTSLLYGNDGRYSVIGKDIINLEILKLLASDEEVQAKFPDNIRNFIYDDNQINDVKLYDLANQLTKLFIDYDKDGFNPDGYQEVLYKKIISDLEELKYSTLKDIYLHKSHFVKSDDVIYFLGFTSFDDIKTLYKDIIHEYSKINDVEFYSLELDSEYNATPVRLVGAPSSLKEIEWVHQEICTLLKNKDVTYSDFLVIAKDISKYSTPIARVFKQDDENFPNIPFVIKGNKDLPSDLTGGLNILFDVIQKHHFTRFDIVSLLSIPCVKKARNITDEDIDNIKKLFVDNNIYSVEDFCYLKTRMLLSKFSTSNLINPLVELTSNKYIPLCNITLTDELIIKIVTIIDDLFNILNLFDDLSSIDHTNIDSIQLMFDSFFSFKNDHELETNKEYKNIIKLFENIKELKLNLSLLIFKFLVLDYSRLSNISKGEIYTSGITFTSFDSNIVFNNKYVFFIGLNSNELPTRNIKNENDLRDYENEIGFFEEKTFNFQYQNTSNTFYMSYINKDLKIDEQLYKSSFVLNLSNKLNLVNVEETISLDENRDWSKLFTRKEFKDKNYYIKLYDFDSRFGDGRELNPIFKDGITVSQIAKFLKEPLSQTIDMIFGKENEYDEKIQEEYEFEISKLDEYYVTTHLINCCLSDASFFDSIKNGKQDLLELLTDEIILNRKIPNFPRDIIFKVVSNCASDAIQLIALLESENAIKGRRQFPNLVLEVDNHIFTISCNSNVLVSAEDDVRKYFELKHLTRNDKNEEFITLYVASLFDVASIVNNTTYKIQLFRNGNPKEFDLTPGMARDILSKIYLLMNDIDNIKFAPIFRNEVNYSTFKKYKKLSNKENEWKYFKNDKILNKDKDLGFTSIDYDPDIVTTHIKTIKDLLIFIKNKGGETNE